MTADQPYPGDPCRTCGHPYAVHEITDDEPGPCWDRADGPDGTPTCACDAFTE